MMERDAQMIELKVDSIRVSLLSPNRLVVLKELDQERYLPIWIDASVADAITVRLQGIKVTRPLTHDLLKNVIEELGAKVAYILINNLSDNTFFARIVMDSNGHHTEVDSRPSDAIALAVRLDVPIFADEAVISQAGIAPSTNLEPTEEEEQGEASDHDLSVFRDFLNGLDTDGLGGG